MASTPWTDERLDALMALHERGLSTAQIAEEMGVTKNTIVGRLYRMRRAGRLATRQDAPLWERLTEAERVDAIRERAEAGVPRPEIGRHFGVPAATIESYSRRYGIDRSAPRGTKRRGPPLAAMRETAQIIPLPGVPFHPPADSLAATRSLSTVGHRECRAVLDDAADQDPGVCGRPVTTRADGELSSYCEEHHRRFHRPATAARAEDAA